MKILAPLFKMWKFTLPILLLLILALYIRFSRTAEPPGEPQPGHTVTIQNAGTVICSNDCLDLAQCGHLDDDAGGMAVMGHNRQPQLTEHNAWIKSGAKVTVLDSRPYRVRELLRSADQPNAESVASEMDILFYLVEDANPEQSAVMWVAGWCIQTIP